MHEDADMTPDTDDTPTAADRSDDAIAAAADEAVNGADADANAPEEAAAPSGDPMPDEPEEAVVAAADGSGADAGPSDADAGPSDAVAAAEDDGGDAAMSDLAARAEAEGTSMMALLLAEGDFQPGQHQRGDDAAKGHRRGHVHPVVEGDARGHVVGAHHQGDQQQRGKGGRAQGAFGGGHGLFSTGRASARAAGSNPAMHR